MTVLFDATTIDMETGEIIETRPNCPFRSATDDKGYCFKEHNSGISNVDPDSYVSIQEMEARCRRGDLVPQYHGSYDTQDIDDIDLADLSNIETDELLAAQRDAELEVKAIVSELERRSKPSQKTEAEATPEAPAKRSEAEAEEAASA